MPPTGRNFFSPPLTTVTLRVACFARRDDVSELAMSAARVSFSPRKSQYRFPRRCTTLTTFSATVCRRLKILVPVFRPNKIRERSFRIRDTLYGFSVIECFFLVHSYVDIREEVITKRYLFERLCPWYHEWLRWEDGRIEHWHLQKSLMLLAFYYILKALCFLKMVKYPAIWYTMPLCTHAFHAAAWIYTHWLLKTIRRDYTDGAVWIQGHRWTDEDALARNNIFGDESIHAAHMRIELSPKSRENL